MRIASLISTCTTTACETADDADDLFDVERDGFDAALGTLRPRARRGYGLLKGRRTRFQSKRRTGKLTVETPVHRGEREIIARN